MEAASLHVAENVTLRRRAPHGSVMKDVSIVVTHGGHGTVSSALAHGRPLLVMPMGRDQGDIAARVEPRGPPSAEADIAVCSASRTSSLPPAATETLTRRRSAEPRSSMSWRKWLAITPLRNEAVRKALPARRGAPS
jgi:hypothetical protein